MIMVNVRVRVMVRVESLSFDLYSQSHLQNVLKVVT